MALELVNHNIDRSLVNQLLESQGGIETTEYFLYKYVFLIIKKKPK